MKKFLILLLLIPAFAGRLDVMTGVNAVTKNSDPVGQYEKFELTVNLTASYTNPFDLTFQTTGLTSGLYLPRRQVPRFV
ncbi:MAG: DUF5060 domain-containing protein [Spirochaetia bacterium]|nr:DUF5060 domain-containing protein [Spirochaetia bacterium]